MKFAYVAAALSAVPALASPVKRQNLDVTVLQFALALEHLEDYFYSHGLRNISKSSFTSAGFDSTYYDNLRRIADDEKAHVALLTAAIKANGQDPVKECNYNFAAMGAYKDAKSFIGLSSVLEGVGTSAYLYGARLITSKDYLNVAGSILVTEALHTSLQRNANKLVPFAEPYGTPLDPTSVYTLAAAFIVDCPSSNNGKIPFVPYPSLAVTASSATPTVEGSVVTFKAGNNTQIPAGSYATFISGLDIVSVQVTGSGNTVSAAVPANQLKAGKPNPIAGQVYVLITPKAANGTIDSAGTVIAGPAIVEVDGGAPGFLGPNGSPYDG